MASQLNFLNSKNYRVYHVDLAKKLNSINAAIFLCELVYQTDKFQEKEKQEKKEYLLRKDNLEWVFLTQEDVQDRTALTRKQQDSALQILEEKGLIKKIVTGIPPKRYFYLNEDKILELFGLSKKVYQFVQKGQIELSETDKLNCTFRTNLYKDIEPDKEPDKENNEHSANASALCKFFIEEIKKKKPNFTKSSISNEWLKAAKKLLAIRTLDQIKKIIEFSSTNEFWFSVILSIPNLLKHLDRLEVQMGASVQKQGNNIATCPENEEFAKMILKKFPEKSGDIVIGSTFIQFSFMGKYKSARFETVYFNMDKFKERVIEILFQMGLSTEGVQ